MTKRLGGAWWAVLCGLVAWSADARTAPVATFSATDLKGEPAIQAGRTVGFFIWADAKQLHVRWSSDGKAVLFSGSIEIGKAPGPIVRINKLAGGWVDLYGEGTIFFSSTAREVLDGFDVELPSGVTAKLDVQIDGEQADVSKVFAGEKLKQPKSLPVRFTQR